MRLVVLDTETTGLNRSRNGEGVAYGHRIVEVGCVEIIDGVVTGNRFHVYVNPSRSIDPKATAIHGITDAFVKDKPPFESIVGDFLEFIGGSCIVIHNAAFDISFLDQEFQLLTAGKPVGVVFEYIDTLELARGYFPGLKNNLDSLCERFGIETRGGFHGALLDAYLLAHIYLRFTKLH